MSFFPRRGGNNYRMVDLHSNKSSRYSGFSSTRSSDNSFDEQVNGTAKRKKRNNKRPAQNSGPGFNQVFKEPNKPPHISHLTGSPRPNPFYQSSSHPRPAFDMNEMPDFVEQQHRGPEWEWQAFFHRSKNWQDKHKLAYYRSRCLALEFENKMLFDQISTLIDENQVFARERGEVPTIQLPHIPVFDGPQPKTHRPSASPGAQATNTSAFVGQQPTTPKPSQGVKATKSQAPQKNQGKKNKEASSSTDPNTDRLEFEISEEMMSFLETSMRHKLNLKLKKQDKNSEEMEVDMNTKQEDKNAEVKNQGPKEAQGLKRKEELDKLYGSSSALIQGLETSIQLQFNRNCDLFKPEVWMAVPLNPETVSC